MIQIPNQSTGEALTRDTFQALMWALSYPGRVSHLPAEWGAYPDNFAAIGRTLLDLETSFYTPDDTLGRQLAYTTARRLPAADAAYHFYPRLDEERLADLVQAPAGTMTYPDRGATLVIGCTLGRGEPFQIEGPGIPAGVPGRLRLAGLPDALWPARAQAIRYPLGWDLFLVDGRQIVGLPRTTLITLES